MGDGDEVLLGAVVEVALEALPLGVAGRDDAGSGAPDLLLDLLAGRHVEAAQEVAQRALGVVHERRGPVDDEPLAVGPDVLVLDDAGRVARPHPPEVLLRPRDVLGRDEELPERRADPRLLGDSRGPLQRAVHAEERPLAVHESKEARCRAHDRAAEVALALEDPLLPRALGEVADDEDELVGAARDDATLVVALLAAQLHRVLDALHLLLVHGAAARGEDRLRDVRRKALVDAPADHLVRGRHQVLLGVDLEAAVHAVGADPEDRVRDRGDERARRRVARRGPVEPLVRRRGGHPVSCSREGASGGTGLAPRRTLRRE